MSERFKYAHPVIEDCESKLLKTLSTDARCEYLTPRDLVDEANRLEKDNAELKKTLGLEKEWSHNDGGVIKSFSDVLEKRTEEIKAHFKRWKSLESWLNSEMKCVYYAESNWLDALEGVQEKMKELDNE